VQTQAAAPSCSSTTSAGLTAAPPTRPAVAQPQHALGAAAERLVVRHQHDGRALGVQLVEQRADLVTGAAVEVAGRLVGEQQARRGDERAGDRRPLRLAARQLGGPVIGAVNEAHALERAQRARAPVVERRPLVEQRRLDVLDHGELRDQVERLEHEADGPVPQRDSASSPSEATLRPSNRCSPAVGRSRQPRIDKSVVLPEPLGPMIASFSPARISRLTPASATTCDAPRG
jgi:hypothetical protein